MNNITEKYAYLGWRMDKRSRAINYGSMAEGYHLAASRLLESLERDNSGHDADAIMYPVLFSGHQSIELYLKAIGLLIAESNGENPWQIEIKDTHNVRRLLNSVNSKLPDDERITKDAATKPLFDYIDMCMRIGDDSTGDYYVDFARYPEHLANKKMPRTSYPFVLKDNKFIFNIHDVKTLINDACNLLDGLYAQWLDRVQFTHANQS